MMENAEQFQRLKVAFVFMARGGNYLLTKPKRVAVNPPSAGGQHKALKLRSDSTCQGKLREKGLGWYFCYPMDSTRLS
jgi:hypothetical protein